MRKEIQGLNFLRGIIQHYNKYLLMEEIMESLNSNTIKILLVEDEFIIQKVHTAILEKLNCSVELAVNGEEALAKSKNGNVYDLIFMDIGLPDIMGTEVIARIRQKEKDSRIPIVVLTAYSDPKMLNEIENAGSNAIYNKPIQITDFQEILATYIKK
jgi:two-component system aerobic respiration control sensor histidine kinase ArcB